MAEKYVTLTSSTNPVLQTLLEEVLKEQGIPFQARECSGTTVIFGAASPLGVVEFLVPENQIQKAKDALCGNGIVCEVSGRLLRRSLEEIVKPLLEKPGDRDLERLAYFVDINNKETVSALFEATLEEKGGRELLEDLFFRLARDSSPALRILAKALSPQVTDAFCSRFHSESASQKVEVRERLLDVLPELPDAPWRFESLVEGLRDENSSIRTAASEALFTLQRGNDYGYDPDAPLKEREEAIEKLME